MIPQEILYCSEFPTTHNGKVDYAELRSLACDLEGESPNDVSAYASSMLCQLLDCKIDDLNRSFFEMGGNSITLLAFISGINDKFDLNVDISKVYQSKNLNNLLNYLGNLQADQGSCNHSFHRSCKELIPVIEPQKKLIIEEHKLMKSAPKELDIHRFSLLYQLIFRKSINVSRMKNAINLVMLKNEIFYVRFLKKGNRYFMKLDDEYHRIEIKTKRKQEHILSNLSMFSLDRKEMIEFIWDDDTSCLYLHIKHILLDYISVQYFIDDILKAYYHTGELPERKGFFFLPQYEKGYERRDRHRILERKNEKQACSYMYISRFLRGKPFRCYHNKLHDRNLRMPKRCGCQTCYLYLCGVAFCFFEGGFRI